MAQAQAVLAPNAGAGRLGRLPRFSSDAAAPPVQPEIKASQDNLTLSSKKPEATKPEAIKSEGPRTDNGKIAEKAFVGALGVGAGGSGYFLSKTMMTFLRDMGPLTLKNVFKSQMLGGAAAGLPFALVQDSFAYKNKEVSAQRYWGNVAKSTLSWGVWGAGALVASALLPFGGFLGVAVGLAAGGLLSSVFDKTIGRKLSDVIAQAIPAKSAKTGADFMVKYLANPIDRAFIQPIKRNWQIFLGTGGIAAVYFGVKSGQGKQALKGLGAMGVSMVPQMFGDSMISKQFPLKPIAGVDLMPGAGQIFNAEEGIVTKKEEEEGK